MVAQVNGIVSGLVATRWFDNAAIPTNQGNVVQDVNWFPNDLTPSQEARKRFALDDDFTVVKHTLQIQVNGAGVIATVILKLTSQDTPTPTVNFSKSILLNGGVALAEEAGSQFDIILVKGASYNIQHNAGGTINPSVFITESFNVDI